MELRLSTWTHHLNQLVYSFYYYCKHEKIKIKIIHDSTIVHNGALLILEGKTVFFDYSDDSLFIDVTIKYSYYFKRSLREKDNIGNVRPLNFNVPMGYRCHDFLLHLDSNLLFDKWSRIEVIKAIDKFGWFTKSSHGILDIRRYPSVPIDSGGRVLFHTRLWNPDNHPDKEEKERRILQNEFRINACRIIKMNFENASVGLFSDALSIKMAPDLLLEHNKSKKNSYLNELLCHDIGIADDGLKDTPGWKIGEYLLYGKAVITTPPNISLTNFNEDFNYKVLSGRLAYQELPDKINCLIENKEYLKMGERNYEWSRQHIHPENYIKRIFSIL